MQKSTGEAVWEQCPPALGAARSPPSAVPAQITNLQPEPLREGNSVIPILYRAILVVLEEITLKWHNFYKYICRNVIKFQT